MSEITVSDETNIALVAIGVLLVFGYLFVLSRRRGLPHAICTGRSPALDAGRLARRLGVPIRKCR